MKNRRAGLIAVCIVLALVLLRPIDREHGHRPGSGPLHPAARQLRRPAHHGATRSTSSRSTTGSTPLRGNVTDADIDRLFLPENFKPIGATHEEPTGRPGTTIIYDSYGVPHVTGKTRADLAFGAGWVTARDRGLLLQLGRGPARAAVADVPGINAFGLVTSGQSFVPSAATEQLVTDQVDLIIQTYGDKGDEMIADMQAEADGMTAYFQAHGNTAAARDRQRRDRGRPRSSARSSVPAAAPRRRTPSSSRGCRTTSARTTAARRGRTRCCSTTPRRRPRSSSASTTGSFTGGPVTGSAVIDEGSIVSLDPTVEPRADRAPAATAAVAPADHGTLGGRCADLPGRRAGAVASRRRTSSSSTRRARPTGNTLAVMGPQLGYYYPEIVQQIHLTGPGIEAQGVGVPGGDDVHPDRSDAGLRVEPDVREPRRARRVRRAALQPRRLGADARVGPLPVPGRVPSVRDVRRGHAQRHADRATRCRCTAR